MVEPDSVVLFHESKIFDVNTNLPIVTFYKGPLTYCNMLDNLLIYILKVHFTIKKQFDKNTACLTFLLTNLHLV